MLKILVAFALAIPLTGFAASADQSGIARGRYMIVTGNCNDCHTPNYPPREGNVPESEWLTGSGELGFRGPWGTTYAPNLRLTVGSMSEDRWVLYAQRLRTRPPMPWFNLNRTTEPDLRAMYQYIKQLGAPGTPSAAYVPPGKEPPQPFVQWPQ